MDQTELIALLAAVGLAALLTFVLAARRRRAPTPSTRRLAAAQLGPQWSPRRGDDHPGQLDAQGRQQRIEAVVARSGADRSAVDTVLTAWDEYLAVLGLAALPPDHAYRVFDPYVPPVAERGPDGRPVPDAARVARDVARRTDVSQSMATTVLEAYFTLEDGATGGAAAS